MLFLELKNMLAALTGIVWITAWDDGVTGEDGARMCGCITPVAARAASVVISLAPAVKEF